MASIASFGRFFSIMANAAIFTAIDRRHGYWIAASFLRKDLRMAGVTDHPRLFKMLAVIKCYRWHIFPGKSESRWGRCCRGFHCRRWRRFLD